MKKKNKKTRVWVIVNDWDWPSQYWERLHKQKVWKFARDYYILRISAVPITDVDMSIGFQEGHRCLIFRRDPD